jgi:undecaprenyl-diphosphatase
MGEYLTLLVLGLVQGLTDIFPISSTAHLALLRQLLDVQTFNLSLAAGLHSGSLVAIAYFLRKDLAIIWMHFLESIKHVRMRVAGEGVSSYLSPEMMLPYLYGLSLVPVAVEGLTLRQLAQDIFGQGTLPVFLMIVNGLIILVTALFARGERTIKELVMLEFLLIGAIQGLAVLPGISRLGLVLCTGLLLRLRWQEALKLTFLLSIPVVIGALLVEFRSISGTLQATPDLILPFLLANLFACAGSWFSLKLLTSQLLERRKLAFFGYYCLMLGIFSSVYLYTWN